ncbi:hypothetical protein N7539_007818 [Penicillium diatomitis]|uniref:Uncharacterized protein n=1 Tax=Penicillium diatomitis TaxID=2819901 RepID=A0A9W9WUF2_9EURO|nr:uncharacterized protein N7539_007818 [Penicillium diatomitis]KAJ5475531.1 hypothetical protein N7539_007818 [Penicillium diatomitis]
MTESSSVTGGRSPGSRETGRDTAKTESNRRRRGEERLPQKPQNDHRATLLQPHHATETELPYVTESPFKSAPAGSWWEESLLLVQQFFFLLSLRSSLPFDPVPVQLHPLPLIQFEK